MLVSSCFSSSSNIMLNLFLWVGQRSWGWSWYWRYSESMLLMKEKIRHVFTFYLVLLNSLLHSICIFASYHWPCCLMGASYIVQWLHVYWKPIQGAQANFIVVKDIRLHILLPTCALQSLIKVYHMKKYNKRDFRMSCHKFASTLKQEKSQWDTKLSQEVNFTRQFLKFEDIFYAIRIWEFESGSP